MYFIPNPVNYYIKIVDVNSGERLLAHDGAEWIKISYIFF